MVNETLNGRSGIKGCEAFTCFRIEKRTIDAFLMQQEAAMRTTVTLEDELVARAQEVTGITERSALLKEALTRLIREEAVRRL